MIAECLDLILRVADGRGGGDDLWPHPASVHLSGAQGFNRRFVQADHGAERPGDQVQLVLDDEIRRRQRPVEPLSASALG